MMNGLSQTVKCEGCGKLDRYKVCMECFTLRVKTKISKKCLCGPLRKPTQLTDGSGDLQCGRCLGIPKSKYYMG
jgi:hypothetical protein